VHACVCWQPNGTWIEETARQKAARTMRYGDVKKLSEWMAQSCAFCMILENEI